MNTNSSARKTLLWGLALGLISLFISMQTGTFNTPVLMTGMQGRPVYGVGTPLIQTGMQAKPEALYVILGLLVVFGTVLHQAPFWSKWGYWLAVALFVCFTPWHYHLIPGAALALTVLAAIQNGKVQKGASPPA